MEEFSFSELEHRVTSGMYDNVVDSMRYCCGAMHQPTLKEALLRGHMYADHVDKNGDWIPTGLMAEFPSVPSENDRWYMAENERFNKNLMQGEDKLWFEEFTNQQRRKNVKEDAPTFCGKPVNNATSFSELIKESTNWNIPEDKRKAIMAKWYHEWLHDEVTMWSGFDLHVARLRERLEDAAEPVDVVNPFAQLFTNYSPLKLDYKMYKNANDMLEIYQGQKHPCYNVGDSKLIVEKYDEYPQRLKDKLCQAYETSQSLDSYGPKRFKAMSKNTLGVSILTGLMDTMQACKEQNKQEGELSIMLEQGRGKYKKLTWDEYHRLMTGIQEKDASIARLNARNEQQNKDRANMSKNYEDMRQRYSKLLSDSDRKVMEKNNSLYKESGKYNELLKLSISMINLLTSIHVSVNTESDIDEVRRFRSVLLGIMQKKHGEALIITAEQEKTVLDRIAEMDALEKQCNEFREKRIEKECKKIVRDYEFLTDNLKTIELYAEFCKKYMKTADLSTCRDENDVLTYAEYFKNGISIEGCVKSLTA